MMAVAIAMIAIGMAVFLPLPTRRLQDFRIYLLSMLGSASGLMLALFLLTRRLPRAGNAVMLGVTVPFVALGYTFAMQQHQRYVNYSLAEQQILQQLVAQAPRLRPRSVVILADRTGFVEDQYMFFYGLYLGAGVQYLYGDQSLEAATCPLGSPGTLGNTCAFGKESVRLSGSTSYQRDQTIPYERIVLLTNGLDDRLHVMTPVEAAAEFGATGYDPYAHIAGSSPTPRAATLFSCTPLMACYRDAVPPSHAFDLPPAGPIGKGWRAAEPIRAGESFRWSLKTSATVDANLAPDEDLALEFNVRSWLEADVVDSLDVSVDGVEIPLTYEAAPPGRVYRGVLPARVIAPGYRATHLVFRVNRLSIVPNAPDVRLGIALGWLRIRPR
jgi:hypothetical protein